MNKGPSLDTFIRWAGSKRSILPQLESYYPKDRPRYIEPFAGSACLFFRLRPAEAVLGDLNGELVCTMRALSRDVGLVLECLRRLPKGRSAYYRVRELDTEMLPDAEIAARFLYLNRYCFNGLYRTNLQGRFNVPYGPPKSGLPQDEAAIVSASLALRSARIVQADFETTLQYARPGDFVYMDPPYAVAKRRVFREYLPGSFADHDLHRLGSVLDSLDSNRVRFVVTYADSREARHLLRRWPQRRLRVRRNIAGFADKRRSTYELLATNFSLESEHYGT